MKLDNTVVRKARCESSILCRGSRLLFTA